MFSVFNRFKTNKEDKKIFKIEKDIQDGIVQEIHTTFETVLGRKWITSVFVN